MKVVALDSAFRNVGVAVGEIKNDIFIPQFLSIIKTKNRKSKSKTIADLEDCIYIHKELRKFIEDVDGIPFEIPGGSQSGRASKLFGYIVGIISSYPNIHPITQSQGKKATGNPKANKKDMVKWAKTNYPNLNWDDFNKGDWEHLADAIAVGIAYTKFYKISQV